VGILGKPTEKTHLKNPPQKYVHFFGALLFVLPIIKHFIQFIVVEASKLLT